jgi:arsenite methyltransferase
MEQGIKSKLTDIEIKNILKERYGKCAETGANLTSSCCAIEASKSSSFATDHSLYTQEDISLIPETALNLSRGCGNPTGFSALQTGEVVVDFGCGAGIDVILASRKVVPNGKVIGIDFAPEMIERAKQSMDEIEFSDNVELCIAELHQTGLPSNFADVVISNCVINLCPDKDAVYQEAYRILKPGGRLAISDVVYIEKIDSQIHERFKKTWSGCVGGAIEKDTYFDIIKNIGFKELHVVSQHPLASNELDEMACCPGAEYTPAPAKEDLTATQNKIASIKFTATKPRTSG